MIKRKLGEKILAAAKKYPVISVVGPRQSGKTTLVRELFDEYEYVNLEDPSTRENAINDPKYLLNRSKLMIIDEVQRVPELLSYIQVIVDEDKSRRFVITGSQNLLVSEKISQSLAGRVNIFKLLPLSIQELTEAKKQKVNVFEQMLVGFYPRIYDEKLDPSTWYDNYIQTYLERDVRQIKNIGDLTTFQKFMGLMAGRTSQILNVASLASDVGVSALTVESWISILEASFIVYRLPSYHRSWNKRLIKSPKIHFVDCGLACALLGIGSKIELENHPLAGYIFESMVVGEYLKNKYNSQDRSKLYYWREKNGKEVDLLEDDGGKLMAVEVKLGQTLSDGMVANIKYFQKLSEEKVEGVLVYGGDESQNRSGWKVRSWRNL